MTEDVATIENKLNRLWLEAGEMAKKWQPLVDWYVTGSVGLQPWNCNEKERDENGRLINIRKFEGDDDFASDYYDFQMVFDSWNDRLEGWLLEASPRFRHRFDEVCAEIEHFSKQYDSQYVYIGEVPELLALYDDFYKKKVAVDDLAAKIESDGWRLKEDDDVVFELIQVEERLIRFLCIKHLNDTYKVHQFRDSYFEKALVEALDKNNKTHRVKTSASKFQSNISKLKIPQKLRKLMIKTSKQVLIVKPQITYGDLKRADLDDIEIVDELDASLEKLELT